MGSFQQITIASILTVLTALALSSFNLYYHLLPNSPITLVLPILSGLIGTFVYFGLIHRTGPSLSGKEILVLGFLATIIWTVVWTGFVSIIWGYDNVTVIANIIMGFPTYTAGVFLCTLILRQIPRKPEPRLTLLPQLSKQFRNDEEILWTGKPAFISSVIPNAQRIMGIPSIVVFIVVGLMGLYTLVTGSGDLLSVVVFVGMISFALATLLSVLIRLIRMMRKRIDYVLTNQRMIIQTGNEKTESVELEDVRDINIRTSPLDDFFERVFKVRTIVVQTSQDSSGRLAFANLKEPNTVWKTFREAVVNNVKGNQLTTSQTIPLPKSEVKTEERVQRGILKRIANAPIQFGYFLEDQAYKMMGGDELMDALSLHLREIGVNATLLDRRTSMRIMRMIQVTSVYPLGCIKVSERNLDFIQVSNCIPGSDESSYRTVVFVYSYAVQLDAYDVRSELEAYFGAIEEREGFFRKKVENLGFQWEGGQLAEVLSKDAELNQKILDLKLERLEVRSEKTYLPSHGWPKIDKTHIFVRITPIPPLTMRALRKGPLKGISTVGRDDFPTREAFDLYDKIAGYIRSVSNSLAEKRERPKWQYFPGI